MMDIATLAQRQLADIRGLAANRTFTPPDDCTVTNAFDIQCSAAMLRQEEGETHIGYKVGCTSPSTQRQLGITHPVFGHLFEGEQHSTGVALSASSFAGLGIEGELAVRLRAPIEPGASVDAIVDALDGVFAVIDLHHMDFLAPRSAAALICANAIHAGVVRSGLPTRIDGSGPSSMTIRIGDQEVSTVEGSEHLDTVLASLSWLAGELHSRGARLEPGQTVLCGTVSGLYPVVAPARITVTTDRFGDVVCDIADH